MRSYRTLAMLWSFTALNSVSGSCAASNKVKNEKSEFDNDRGEFENETMRGGGADHDELETTITRQESNGVCKPNDLPR